MAKGVYLAAYFLLGCIGSSLIASLPKLHPSLLPTATLLYVLGIFAWVLGWLADDAIIKFFKVSPAQYYALLLSCGVAVAVGGVTQWLVG